MILRDAARTTLAARTARVSQQRFLERGDKPAQSEEGVTDFARRRTRTSTEWTERWPFLDKLGERHPWLDDGEEPGQSEMVYAGTAAWFVYPDGAPVRLADGDPNAPARGRTDPVWIVEALENLQHEDRRADDRFAFLLAIAPRLAGEAWLDGDGRIVRVTWSTGSDERGWRTTELWDFGTPATIELPEATRNPPLLVGLARTGWSLWRRRRAYRG